MNIGERPNHSAFLRAFASEFGRLNAPSTVADIIRLNAAADALEANEWKPISTIAEAGSETVDLWINRRDKNRFIEYSPAMGIKLSPQVTHWRYAPAPPAVV